tara:strand:+ start:225 stop:341 length:117 start_codon:yes stop_codon:yes gene_type:complete
MKVVERKGKWVGYDDNNNIVIISHDRQLVLNHMEKLER